jgi:hypothetical protein
VSRRRHPPAPVTQGSGHSRMTRRHRPVDPLPGMPCPPCPLMALTCRDSRASRIADTGRPRLSHRNRRRVPGVRNQRRTG